MLLLFNQVEILRNIQSILSIAKPLGTGKRKVLKQEEAAENAGAANALAYLTDSFGGQLAGQILSVILSSVTGDVRGILGNSLNLFQSEERRDQVQLFLDDLSQNFLKFTGLGALVTTKSPLQSTPFPGGTYLYPGTNGQTQLQGIQPAQAISVASLGGGSTGTAFAPASATLGGGQSNIASLGSAAGTQNLQQGAGTAAGQQPIIYVLPQIGGADGSGTSGTKQGTTSNKATTSSSSIDDDSEEERKLWSDYKDHEMTDWTILA